MNEASLLRWAVRVQPASAPDFVAVDPSGRFVYVANNGNSTVSQYTINPTSGALTLIATAIATGGAIAGPSAIAIDSSGHYAYVANQGNDTVSQYTIGANGVLALIGTIVGVGAPMFGTGTPMSVFATGSIQ